MPSPHLANFTTGSESVTSMALNSQQQYADEITTFPTLSQKEERRLGNLIADGRSAEIELSYMANEQRAEKYYALCQITKDGRTAQHALVQANLRLVIPVARDYEEQARKYGISMDELISDGNVGLMRAAIFYNGEEPFYIFADRYIRNSIFQSIRQHQKDAGR